MQSICSTDGNLCSLLSVNSDSEYYLLMEDGGFCLFDFVVKMHKFVEINKLDIAELQRVAKIILKQMIEAIDYIHSKNIAHMDISLENWLINDLDIRLDQYGKISISKCIEY